MPERITRTPQPSSAAAEPIAHQALHSQTEPRSAHAAAAVDAFALAGGAQSPVEAATSPAALPAAAVPAAAGQAIPDDMCCPITLQIMAHPVVASDGFTYERHAILAVFAEAKGRHTAPVSPLTRAPLTLALTPATSLQVQIEDLSERFPKVAKELASSRQEAGKHLQSGGKISKRLKRSVHRLRSDLGFIAPSALANPMGTAHRRLSQQAMHGKLQQYETALAATGDTHERAVLIRKIEVLKAKLEVRQAISPLTRLMDGTLGDRRERAGVGEDYEIAFAPEGGNASVNTHLSAMAALQIGARFAVEWTGGVALLGTLGLAAPVILPTLRTIDASIGGVAQIAAAPGALVKGAANLLGAHIGARRARERLRQEVPPFSV